MYNIVFLRGAPGVGKSTLSKKLKSIFPNGVTIEVGNILKMINDFNDGDSKQYSDSLDCVYNLVLDYLHHGYNPVLIIGPMKYKRMKNHFLSKLKLNYCIITLVSGNDVLDYRIDNREIGFKNKKIAHAVNANMMEYRLDNEIYFDTSDKSPDDVFYEIKELINQ